MRNEGFFLKFFCSGFLMPGYGYSYSTSSYGGKSSCDIPQHNETIKVPHYTYVRHVQPMQKVWVEKKLQFREVPVTQELSQEMHPTQEICVSAKAPCAPACKPACPSPCGGYGYGGYGYPGGAYGGNFSSLY